MVVTGPVCSWGVATTFRVSNSQTTISPVDRKSTRLNSSHLGISYAVFCLKKKKDKLVARCHNEDVARLALKNGIVPLAGAFSNEDDYETMREASLMAFVRALRSVLPHFIY